MLRIKYRKNLFPASIMEKPKKAIKVKATRRRIGCYIGLKKRGEQC